MIEFAAEFFRSGGPLMWVILAVLAAAVAVIVERLHFYAVACREDADTLVTSVVRKLNGNDYKGALALVTGRRSPVGAILAQAVARFNGGHRLAEVRRGVEEVAIREVPQYARRIGYLAMLANIATLTGLLGTIFGLQKSFSSLAVVEAAEKASVLAAGISQAMNTTAFGLIVAIPCLVAYTRLSSLQARKTEECDAAAVKLLNYLETRQEAQQHQPADVFERAAV
jgi:biopolymer transport protein ExbB/TolQ